MLEGTGGSLLGADGCIVVPTELVSAAVVLSTTVEVPPVWKDLVTNALDDSIAVWLLSEGTTGGSVASTGVEVGSVTKPVVSTGVSTSVSGTSSSGVETGPQSVAVTVTVTTSA